MATFHVTNFGCRATQADGAAIERQFQEQGWERAAGPAEAEVVVLNTCTVTAAADQDARAAIRRIHRHSPKARIVVTGCYAQRAPEEVAALPGVAAVVGNSHKHQLAELVDWRGQNPDHGLGLTDLGCKATPRLEGFVPLARLTSEARSPIFISDIFAHTELQSAPVFDAANERTRPNLKVQDGCDNRCTFCVIPYVRGQSRSLKLEEILREVNALVGAGYREVVISGINLGRWGRDLTVDLQPFALSRQLSVISTHEHRPTGNEQRRSGFEDLLRAILSRTTVEKLRISSVEPMDWSDELIQLMATSSRIAKHAHVPMQSGSDAVLRRMRRRYRPWHYREKIEKIRAAMPTAAIGADVMVGFPGETESEFEQTRRMVEDLPFTYLHVFSYSARPGTPAAAMGKPVPAQVARERNRILRELATEKKQAFMLSLAEETVEAITLNAFDGECTQALTDNYLTLHLRGRHESNLWVTARVLEVKNGALAGERA